MENFIKKWEQQLKQISFIFQYLHTYPNVLLELRIEDLISPKELDKQYKEWLWLYSKYDGAEKEFFKPYWIPIQRVGFDYFIDMSDNNYPIIEAFFDYFEEPYHWEKKILFYSITEPVIFASAS